MFSACEGVCIRLLNLSSVQQARHKMVHGVHEKTTRSGSRSLKRRRGIYWAAVRQSTVCSRSKLPSPVNHPPQK